MNVQKLRGTWWAFLLQVSAAKPAKLPVDTYTYHRGLVPWVVAVFNLHITGPFQKLGSTAFSGAEGKSEQRKTIPFLHVHLLNKNFMTI